MKDIYLECLKEITRMSTFIKGVESTELGKGKTGFSTKDYKIKMLYGSNHICLLITEYNRNGKPLDDPIISLYECYTKDEIMNKVNATIRR